MPQKSHRIAAQQAKIRKRRKKGSKGPLKIPPSTLPKEASIQEPSISIPETQSSPEKASTIIKHQPEVPAKLRKLVTAELVRICLLMGVIFIILVVVSIILN